MSFGRSNRRSDHEGHTRRSSGVRGDNINGEENYYATGSIRSPSASRRQTLYRRRENSSAPGVYISPMLDRMSNSEFHSSAAYPTPSPSPARSRPQQQAPPTQRLLSPGNERPQRSPARPQRLAPAAQSTSQFATQLFIAALAVLLTLTLLHTLFFRQSSAHVQHHALYAGVHEPVAHPDVTETLSDKPMSTPSEPAAPAVSTPSRVDSSALYSAARGKFERTLSPSSPAPSRSWWSSLLHGGHDEPELSARALPQPVPSTPSPVLQSPAFTGLCSAPLRSLDPVARLAAEVIIKNGTDALSGVCADDTGKNQSSLVWPQVLSVWGGEFKLEKPDMAGSFAEAASAPVEERVVVSVESDDLLLIDDEAVRQVLAVLTTPLSAEELRRQWQNITRVVSHLDSALGAEQASAAQRQAADDGLVLLAKAMVGEREGREGVVADGRDDLARLRAAVMEAERAANERAELAKMTAAQVDDASERAAEASELSAKLRVAEDKVGKAEARVRVAREKDTSAIAARRECESQRREAEITAKITRSERDMLAAESEASAVAARVQTLETDIVLLRRAEKDGRHEVGRQRALLRQLRGAGPVDGTGDAGDAVYVTVVSELGRVERAIEQLKRPSGDDSEAEYADLDLDMDEEEQAEAEDEALRCPEPAEGETQAPECQLAQRLARLRELRLTRLEQRAAKLKKLMGELEGDLEAARGESAEQAAVHEQVEKLRAAVVDATKKWERARAERVRQEDLVKKSRAVVAQTRADADSLRQVVVRLMQARAEDARAHEHCARARDGAVAAAREAREAAEAGLSTAQAEVRSLKFSLETVHADTEARRASQIAREAELLEAEAKSSSRACELLVKTATSVVKCEVEAERQARREQEWVEARGARDEYVATWKREAGKVNVLRRALGRTLG